MVEIILVNANKRESHSNSVSVNIVQESSESGSIFLVRMERGECRPRSLNRTIGFGITTLLHTTPEKCGYTITQGKEGYEVICKVYFVFGNESILSAGSDIIFYEASFEENRYGGWGVKLTQQLVLFSSTQKMARNILADSSIFTKPIFCLHPYLVRNCIHERVSIWSVSSFTFFDWINMVIWV